MRRVAPPRRPGPVLRISAETHRHRRTGRHRDPGAGRRAAPRRLLRQPRGTRRTCASPRARPRSDRKSTRLNSSHSQISYAVFCLKKKTPNIKSNVEAIEFVIQATEKAAYKSGEA